jgi:hypothetical protein
MRGTCESSSGSVSGVMRLIVNLDQGVRRVTVRVLAALGEVHTRVPFRDRVFQPHEPENLQP